MTTTIPVDLEGAVEAEDGVVEVGRVRPHMDMPWAVVPPGPRRWAPTDLAVEVDEGGGRLLAVRMTYKTVGDRSVVVAGVRAGADVDHVAERMATPLLFAHLRRTHPQAPVSAITAAMDCRPAWGAPDADGRRPGTAGRGDRPVRLAHIAREDGHVVIAMHGVAEEEAATILGAAQLVTREDEVALADLHTRHRQALAQRWWDAPRVPWTPTD